MLSAVKGEDHTGSLDNGDFDVPSESARLRPRCVATTGNAFAADHRHESNFLRPRHESNFFKEAQISADGTTIVTLNDDQCLRTFVIPEDLLDETKQPHELSAHSSLSTPTFVQSYTLYPQFSLADLSTTLILSSSSDQHIQVTNAIHENYIHATYPHINPRTEAYIAPSSLEFVNTGTHFVAGSQGLVSVFDTSRIGSGPVTKHKTKPKDATEAIYSMRDNSKITALSVSCDGNLAAGSLGRTVGLFPDSGHGRCVTSFSVATNEDEADGTGGTGITSLGWSPDGKYLLVAERQSDVIHVYDVRNQSRRVAFLSGRNAKTSQRLGFSVIPTREGHEVWAGGADGNVRMWRNPGALEGEQKPSEEFAMHNDAVSSAVWHPGGMVMATCSGSRAAIEALEDSDSESDGERGAFADAQASLQDDTDESDSVDSDGALENWVPVTHGAVRSRKEPDNTLKLWTV